MALICHCEAVGEQTILSVIGPECVDIGDLARRCGAGARCGGCHPALAELLARYVANPGDLHRSPTSARSIPTTETNQETCHAR